VAQQDLDRLGEPARPASQSPIQACPREGGGRVAPQRTSSARRFHRDQPGAERVVAVFNHRGTAEQWITEGKGAIQLDAAVPPNLRRQYRPPLALCARLQSRQFHADACDAHGGGARGR
jgi:hypothetical protein